MAVGIYSVDYNISFFCVSYNSAENLVTLWVAGNKLSVTQVQCGVSFWDKIDFDSKSIPHTLRNLLFLAPTFQSVKLYPALLKLTFPTSFSTFK